MKAHHKRPVISVIVLLMSLDILAAQSQATKRFGYQAERNEPSVLSNRVVPPCGYADHRGLRCKGRIVAT